MTSVPNTNTFSLQNVYDSIYSHDTTVQRNLLSCFDKSVASYFDANYGSKTMNPKTLYGFRNYTPTSGGNKLLATWSPNFQYYQNTLRTAVYNGTLQVAPNGATSNGTSLNFTASGYKGGAFIILTIRSGNNIVYNATSTNGIFPTWNYTFPYTTTSSFIATITFDYTSWSFPQAPDPVTLVINLVDGGNVIGQGSVSTTLPGTTPSPLPALFVPDIFTPNGDGINDLWVIQNLWYYGTNTEMSVRYKVDNVPYTVYHTYDYANNLWDGRDNVGDLFPIGTRVPSSPGYGYDLFINGSLSKSGLLNVYYTY